MEALKNNFRGYDIFDKGLDELPAAARITINTINQYSFCIAEEDAEFKRALTESDVLLPDGIGIVVAVDMVNGAGIKKISGSDVHQHLLKKLNAAGGSCFYMGSSERTLVKIKQRLALEYPRIRCSYYSPPFKARFSQEDNNEIIRRINNSNSDVVFVGMTAPKQEKWVNEHKGLINPAIICSIGAVFDFYAGTVKRPADIWVNMGLEWLVRLCKEPKRMWKRYVYYGPIFMYILLKEKLNTMGNR